MPKKKMRKLSWAQTRRLLLQLARFLLELKPGRFNFKEWAGDDWEGKPDLSCGTTACAMGWATTLPSFRKLGLRLVRLSRTGIVLVGRVGMRVDGHDSSIRHIADALNLSFDDAAKLFIPSNHGGGHMPSDSTAAEVARHIERYVKRQDKKKRKAA